jgi:hypothetical protein
MEYSISYKYQRSDYPFDDVIGNEKSRNHIISYPFMFSFAITTLVYLANNEDENNLNKFLEFAKKSGIPGFVADSQDAKAAWNKKKALFTLNEKDKWYCYNLSESKPGIGARTELLPYMAWAKSNLFIGPKACYRTDDPSQRREEIPNSMMEKHKNASEELLEFWNKKISTSRIVGENNQEINIDVKEKERNSLKTFVGMFLDYLNSSNEYHETVCGDWLVYDCSNGMEGKYYHFIIAPSFNSKQPEKCSHYKFCLNTSGRSGKIQQNCYVKLSNLSDGVGELLKGNPTQKELNETVSNFV